MKDKPNKRNAPKAPDQSEVKRPVGRPTDYSEDLVADICAQIAEGLSVRTICKADDMPEARTIFRWLARYPQFCQQYEKAMEQRALVHIEELQDIADDGTNDWMEKHSRDGDSLGWFVNGEAIQRSKLRIDTRKWAASKLLPKKYGDKIEHEHKGEITNIQVLKFSDAGKDNPDT